MAHRGMGRMGGREASMNRAEAEEPKSGHRPAADSRGNRHDHVGGERKADMRGALEGNPTDHNPLTHAVHELHRQHPIAHHEHGPHHGTDHHHRHEPMHGMGKPKVEAHHGPHGHGHGGRHE